MRSSLVSKKLKVVVAQMRPIPGDIQGNFMKMKDIIARARVGGANIVVFPELATSGYLIGDLWGSVSFLHEIEDINEAIRKESGNGDGITVIFGSVRVDWNRVGLDGQIRRYNAAMVAQNGEWVLNGSLCGWVPKTNIPGYGIFDDPRYFYPADRLAYEKGVHVKEILRPFTLSIGGTEYSFGATVCEDIWQDAYGVKPVQIYQEHGVDLIINLSCSPWTMGKRRARIEMLKSRVKEAGVPILYVNAVGLQNNVKNLVWFDGGSMFIDRDSKIVWRAETHVEKEYPLAMESFSRVRQECVPLAGPYDDDTTDIYKAIVSAMEAFYPKGKKVIIGLSGGIDSAASLALHVDAVGAKNILAVNMPTEYNSQTTQDLARKCAETFGVEYRVVPIQESYMTELKSIEALYPNIMDMRDEHMDLVRENIQARLRGRTLATIAQIENGLIANNSNKTESALNYFTLYGDSVGAACFLADCWKGQIYDLARFYNKLKGREMIPQGIIDIIPSAELSKKQNVDEGKGDPIFYPYHDKLLRMFIEERWDITMVMKSLIGVTLEKDLGCEEGTLRKYFKTPLEMIKNLEWAWGMCNIDYKRAQTPPILIVSSRALGYDRRGVIADAYFSSDYRVMKANYLSSMEGGW